MKYLSSLLFTAILFAACKSGTKQTPKTDITPDKPDITLAPVYHSCGDTVYTQPGDTFYVVISQSGGRGDSYVFDSKATPIRLVSQGLKDNSVPEGERPVGGTEAILYKFISGKLGHDNIKFDYSFQGQPDSTQNCWLHVWTVYKTN